MYAILRSTTAFCFVFLSDFLVLALELAPGSLECLFKSQSAERYTASCPLRLSLYA